MPAAVMKPAARALRREERDGMLSKVLPVILPKQSVSIVRRQIVLIIPIISALPTMWILKGAVPATVMEPPARLLRKNKDKTKLNYILTEVKECDILYKCANHNSKQSIHSHLTTIGSVSVQIITPFRCRSKKRSVNERNQVDSYAIHFFCVR